MNHMQGMPSNGHDIHGDSASADAKTRMRSVRAAAPQFMPMQKSMNGGGPIGNAQGANVPSGVFGKKKGWADQIADEEALHGQQMMGIRTGGHMNNASNRQLPYVLPSAAITSKPPSPVDNVKFVNSTVENLQSQIKKEEAPKKKRTRTSPEQLRILQKAFATDPMPSSQARLALSKKLGMNPRAVQVWFQNRRAKAKRAEALGLSGQMEDDLPTGSEDEDELGHLEATAGQLHHYQQHNVRQQQQQKMPSRAASMSSYIPMGYPPAMDHNSCYGLQPNQAAAFFDPSTFMEPVENVFDPEMALPGLDFSIYGGYGTPSNYAMPMQGMFSLPMGSYDQPGSHAYGYSVVSGQYPSYPDEVNLNDAVLGRFETDENNALGPINPLSALLDAHNMEARQHYAAVKDDLGMANAARYSHNQSPPGGSSRRSYSLNDIHAQLTTQQIQTLESIGLPALGPGPSKTTLGCIREEDDTGAGLAAGRHVSTGSPDYSTTTQDQLLSTIDDLRMDSFWDTTAPGN